MIENVYRLQIMNTDEKARQFTISATGLAGLKVVGVTSRWRSARAATRLAAVPVAGAAMRGSRRGKPDASLATTAAEIRIAQDRHRGPGDSTIRRSCATSSRASCSRAERGSAHEHDPHADTDRRKALVSRTLAVAADGRSRRSSWSPASSPPVHRGVDRRRRGRRRLLQAGPGHQPCARARAACRPLGLGASVSVGDGRRRARRVRWNGDAAAPDGDDAQLSACRHAPGMDRRAPRSRAARTGPITAAGYRRRPGVGSSCWRPMRGGCRRSRSRAGRSWSGWRATARDAMTARRASVGARPGGNREPRRQGRWNRRAISRTG